MCLCDGAHLAQLFVNICIYVFHVAILHKLWPKKYLLKCFVYPCICILIYKKERRKFIIKELNGFIVVYFNPDSHTVSTDINK